jgi:hypothetical protein
VRPRGDDFLGHFTIFRRQAPLQRCRPQVGLGDTEDIGDPSLEADSPGDDPLVGPAPHGLRIEGDSLGQTVGGNAGLLHRLTESVVARHSILLGT